jgi:hypothetical protein
MLTVFTISTIVLAIAIVFTFMKNTSLKNQNEYLWSQLELMEAELDLAKIINKSLKNELSQVSKPTEVKKKSPSKKKYYPRKPKNTETKPNA